VGAASSPFDAARPPDAMIAGLAFAIVVVVVAAG
jgi:hypothetical protein